MPIGILTIRKLIHLINAQFDNLKRISKQVEDSEGRSITDEIQAYFMLCREHARYARVLAHP